MAIQGRRGCLRASRGSRQQFMRRGPVCQNRIVEFSSISFVCLSSLNQIDGVSPSPSIPLCPQSSPPARIGQSPWHSLRGAMLPIWRLRCSKPCTSISRPRIAPPLILPLWARGTTLTTCKLSLGLKRNTLRASIMPAALPMRIYCSLMTRRVTSTWKLSSGSHFV